MIDTNKYEGHTPADDWEKHLIDALFETEFPMTYQDMQLMADAPLLLAEVKRLREGIKNYDACLQNLWDRELIPEDTDIWDEVKELLELIECLT